jgi:hypothetical protein
VTATTMSKEDIAIISFLACERTHLRANDFSQSLQSKGRTSWSAQLAIDNSLAVCLLTLSLMSLEIFHPAVSLSTARMRAFEGLFFFPVPSSLSARRTRWWRGGGVVSIIKQDGGRSSRHVEEIGPLEVKGRSVWQAYRCRGGRRYRPLRLDCLHRSCEYAYQRTCESRFPFRHLLCLLVRVRDFSSEENGVIGVGEAIRMSCRG